MRASTAVLALSASLVSAQGSTGSAALIQAVNNTIRDIGALNGTLNGIPLTSSDFGLTVFSLLSGSNALQADISNATTAAQGSSQFSDSESASVFNALFTLVEPTFELLDNFAAHCPAFARAGLQPTVAQQLGAQYGAVQNETNAIVSKLSGQYAMSAQVGGGLFQRGFNSLLNIYSGALCNETAACAGGATPAAGGSGATPAAGGAGATSSARAPGSATITSVTSAAGPFTVPSRPATFTGAAVKDKRSPIGSFLAIF